MKPHILTLLLLVVLTSCELTDIAPPTGPEQERCFGEGQKGEVWLQCNWYQESHDLVHQGGGLTLVEYYQIAQAHFDTLDAELKNNLRFIDIYRSCEGFYSCDEDWLDSDLTREHFMVGFVIDTLSSRRYGRLIPSHVSVNVDGERIEKSLEW